MTESNAKIMKIALSLLAVVSIVLIIVFAANVGKNDSADDENYDDYYVDGGEDDLGNQDIDEDIYFDDGTLDDYDTLSDSDLLSDSDF